MAKPPPRPSHRGETPRAGKEAAHADAGGQRKNAGVAASCAAGADEGWAGPDAEPDTSNPTTYATTRTTTKGALAGARVEREHQELVFISINGLVQRTAARGINRYGRASQGVRVMNVREDDRVSAVALVMESEADTAAAVSDVSEDGAGPEPAKMPDLDTAETDETDET
jgi:hypothetical protein